MADYIISFKRGDGKFRVWSSSTEKIMMLNHNDNEATDEDLEEYSKNFKRWFDELKVSKLNIDYRNYDSEETCPYVLRDY